MYVQDPGGFPRPPLPGPRVFVTHGSVPSLAVTRGWRHVPAAAPPTGFPAARERRGKRIGKRSLFRGQQGADPVSYPFPGHDQLDLGLGLFYGNGPDCRLIEWCGMCGIVQLFPVFRHLLHKRRCLFPVSPKNRPDLSLLFAGQPELPCHVIDQLIGRRHHFHGSPSFPGQRPLPAIARGPGPEAGNSDCHGCQQHTHNDPPLHKVSPLHAVHSHLLLLSVAQFGSVGTAGRGPITRPSPMTLAV